MIESTYEGEWDSSPLQIRRQIWWSVCGGATGTFIGNYPIWRMAKGWLNQWESPGAKAMTVTREILSRIPWWSFSVDEKREMLVNGWGEGHGTNRAGFTVGENNALGYFLTQEQLN